jgi:hypothetical protein
LAGEGEYVLSLKQYKAIESLLSGDDMGTAAKKAGCTSMTIRRWLSKDANFAALFRSLRQEVINQTITRIIQSGTEAVDTLRRNLRGKPEVEVRAAKVILDKLLNAAALMDLKAEIEAFKAAQAAAQRKANGPHNPELAGGAPPHPQGGAPGGAAVEPPGGPPPAAPGGSALAVPLDGLDGRRLADALRAFDEPEGEPLV